MKRIWHWLDGHKWEVWSAWSDGKSHYLAGDYYAVTHVLLRCKECGWVKSRDIRGAFNLAPKDTLAEAISYLEKK